MSIAPVQFILQQYHRLNKKEEFQFLLSLVRCVFCESQTDLKFAGDVAGLLAEYRYESKASQTTMHQAVEEKLVAIRNEAEEKKQASLCGQALILQRLSQCLQSRKPFELPKCIVRNKPHQIITTFITDNSTSYATGPNGEPSAKRARIQSSKQTQTTQTKSKSKAKSKAKTKAKAKPQTNQDSDSDYMECLVC